MAQVGGVWEACAPELPVFRRRASRAAGEVGCVWGLWVAVAPGGQGALGGDERGCSSLEASGAAAWCQGSLGCGAAHRWAAGIRGASPCMTSWTTAWGPGDL